MEKLKFLESERTERASTIESDSESSNVWDS